MSEMFEKGIDAGRSIEKDKVKWTKGVLAKMLTKKGKYLYVDCPFHEEITPSCVYDPMEDDFFCFTCEETGDGYKLAQKLDSKDQE